MIDSLNLKNVQGLSRNFFLATRGDDCETFLVSEKLQILTSIRPGGYVPKSGLLLAEYLIRLKIRGKTLDIGTGESGILATCLSALGSSCVIASDIDSQATQWARQASNKSPCINWVNCDLFPGELANGMFEVIVSNPPQMPMSNPGHPHDYGGPDGRDYVFRIIKEGKQLLRQNGRLLLLCFDFLGVDCSFGRQSIVSLAQMNSMQTRIVARHQRVIRRGGKTEENIQWIKTMYPGYSFKKDAYGNLVHEILILEMRHGRTKKLKEMT